MITPIWAQHRYRAHLGQATGDRFGSAVANLGDIDADGISDYAVAAAGASYSGTLSGRVYAMSGANGLVRWRVDGAVWQLFGSSLAGGRDVDLDGINDVVVGRVRALPPSSGFTVRSGLDGSLISFGELPAEPLILSISCTMIDDMDGDGSPDFVVGRRFIRDTRSTNDLCFCSGFTGSLLARFIGNMGLGVEVVGDYDADGTRDLAVSGQNSTIRSGRTGAVLRTYTGINSSVVTSVTDLDGDGLPEPVFAGSTTSCVIPLPPSIQCVSSANGATLWSFDWCGETSCARICDIDGDKFEDIALCAPGGLPYVPGALPGLAGALAGGNPGAMVTLSGRTGDLLSFVPGDRGNGTAFGTQVARLGDLDQDGNVEFACTSDRFANFQGRMVVFTGGIPPTPQLPVLASETYLGNPLGCGVASASLWLPNPGLLSPGSSSSLQILTLPVRPGLLSIDTGAPKFQQSLGCSAFLDFARFSQWSTIPFQTDPTGAASFQINVPNVPTLVGRHAVAQALIDTGVGPAFTNGLSIIIGF